MQFARALLSRASPGGTRDSQDRQARGNKHTSTHSGRQETEVCEEKDSPFDIPITPVRNVQIRVKRGEREGPFDFEWRDTRPACSYTRSQGIPENGVLTVASCAELIGQLQHVVFGEKESHPSPQGGQLAPVISHNNRNDIKRLLPDTTYTELRHCRWGSGREHGAPLTKDGRPCSHAARDPMYGQERTANELHCERYKRQ